VLWCRAPSADLRAGPTREIALMTQTYTAVIKQSGPWWIGWIEEVPGVNCQERSRAELLDTLKVTLREALEFNRREALDAAGEAFEEAPIAV
jgi:predicted RNase H-like HicB family nuclease